MFACRTPDFTSVYLPQPFPRFTIQLSTCFILSTFPTYIPSYPVPFIPKPFITPFHTSTDFPPKHSYLSYFNAEGDS